jgi:quercetin dioxygenase-like cupin family protein
MIVRPDQARVYSMGRGEARILVDAERSGGTWWLGQFREDPGYTTGLHFHPKTDEQFFVLDGVLSVYLDNSWHDLEPGTLAVVPHGTPHAQANAGEQPVQGFSDQEVLAVSSAFFLSCTSWSPASHLPIRNSASKLPGSSAGTTHRSSVRRPHDRSRPNSR